MKLIPALLLSLLSPSAFAINHYDAPASGCRALQRSVAQDREAIIHTGTYTYFRVIAEGEYCQPGDRVSPKYTKTKDVAQCYVGRECKEPK